MVKRIKKVAIIGSGVMGSRIACHFANIGAEVLLLDISPKELTDEEKAKGLTIDHPKVKNRIVQEAFDTCLKTKPASLYLKEFKERVSLGNLDDDLPKIENCDWVIEAVVERLDIKHSVYEQVEKYRKEDSIISTNTSGIPINMLSEGRSDNFKQNFCGTHFFNPPRYLQLLEIIPGPETRPELLDFLQDYGQRFLGKTTILCKDTPAFIANRVGVQAMMNTFHLAEKLELSVTDIDNLTGTLIGRAKSATFRTSDVVGLDTLAHVAKGVSQACPNDESVKTFAFPSYLQEMLDKNMLGSKTKKGFYKQVKDENGKRILALNLSSLEYEAQDKTKFPSISEAKKLDQVKDRFSILLSAKDVSGEFYRQHFYSLFSYVANRVPEISDEIYSIDEAIKAGFGWEIGPFEIWDAIGLEPSIEKIETAGHKLPDWVKDLAKSQGSFYKIENGKRSCYDVDSKQYQALPGGEKFIVLPNLYKDKTVWSNAEAALLDLGDGILNLEFRSKMNTLGGDVLAAIHKSIAICEKNHQGLVIANQGQNFSVGANLGLIFMMAAEQDYDELNIAIKTFQDTMMRIRYSSIPVVLGVHGMCFGGGVEAALHADAVQAQAETYMGLVEFGVGVIPGGGGTKELTARATKNLVEGDLIIPHIRHNYLTIGMAKVSTSAHEAYDLGLLQRHKDKVSINPKLHISDAKKTCLAFADSGYTQPISEDILVLGKQTLGLFEVGAESMKSSNYISEHDQKISQKLAWVMSGGDLSEPSYVSEQYLLDLEREAFLSLCGERKTLERIEHMIKTGKPLRN